MYWNLDGSVIDLNSLIDPASGWTLKAATDISDSGWIFGLGDFDPDGAGGQAAYARMFIMQVPTTIPEPAAGALALLGVSSMLLLRRRSLGDQIRFRFPRVNHAIESFCISAEKPPSFLALTNRSRRPIHSSRRINLR